jgi:hypothetical protein
MSHWFGPSATGRTRENAASVAISLTQEIGDGIPKAVSKLCLHWLKTARMGRYASLEFDNVFEEISWDGIRLDLDQLKEWLTRYVISEPQ